MAKRNPKVVCPVTDYADKVLAGEILAGRLVRLACERHKRDLVDGPKRGLEFNAAKVERIIKFYGCLKLPDSEQNFVLQPWQAFIQGSIFGWLGPDGKRRFRTSYVETGKGSGKTPMSAGTGLYGMVMDDEEAAEVYPAATTRDQASIAFRDCKNIAEASTILKKYLLIQLNNIAYEKTRSFMRPISAEHRGLDGKRVHMALIDELHEHPNSMVVDKMRAGTKGRAQALIYMITNSGYDRESVCWRQRAYAEKVLEGLATDDSLFAYVCQLDPCDKCFAEGQRMPVETCKDCDDWRDPKVWPKANPNLGVTIKEKYLEEQVREAVGMPAKENIVKRLNFCLWTQTGLKGAIPMVHWQACSDRVDNDFLRGLQCQAGLDLGLTSDFTAFVLVFTDDTTDRRILRIKPYFWIPESSIEDPSNPMAEQYRMWANAGHLRVTSGNVVDYDVVRRDICSLAGVQPAVAGFAMEGDNVMLPPLTDGPFWFQKIRMDRSFQGAQLATQLMGDGFQVEVIGQGFMSMTAPTKEFLELIKGHRLAHDDNPCMNWQASNFAVELGPAGMKPTKAESGGKIDGPVAAICGVASAVTELTGGYVKGALYG